MLNLLDCSLTSSCVGKRKYTSSYSASSSEVPPNGYGGERIGFGLNKKCLPRSAHHGSSTTTGFCFRHHLPIGLVLGAVFGMAWPTPGGALSQIGFSNVCVVGMFFISRLNLTTKEIKEAASECSAALVWGLVSILFVTSVGWTGNDQGFESSSLPYLMKPSGETFVFGLLVFVKKCLHSHQPRL